MITLLTEVLFLVKLLRSSTTRIDIHAHYRFDSNTHTQIITVVRVAFNTLTYIITLDHVEVNTRSHPNPHTHAHGLDLKKTLVEALDGLLVVGYYLLRVACFLHRKLSDIH